MSVSPLLDWNLSTFKFFGIHYNIDISLMIWYLNYFADTFSHLGLILFDLALSAFKNLAGKIATFFLNKG